MAKAVYPHEVRTNVLSSMYCEMAMESYYNATIKYEEIKNTDCSWACGNQYDAVYKSIISTTIFAAMSIEAFLNDYLAACLGDSEFYGNFDRLSVLGKFELLAVFLLKTPVDKSQSYYSLLKVLFQQRDAYIHSKSKHHTFQGYTEKELEEQHSSSDDLSDTSKINSNDLQEGLNSALDALKAVKNIAEFVDKYDSNAWAMIRLFGMTSLNPEEWGKYKAPVLKLLGIRTLVS